MTNRDILDEIDALVDEQMNNPTRVQPTRCPHCGREFHGLAITQRMEEMRQEHLQRLYEQQVRILRGEEIGDLHYAESELDPDYRYDLDESPVLCPGSMFIGPRQPTEQERAYASHLPWPNADWPAPGGLLEWQRHLIAQMITGLDHTVIDRWLGNHGGAGPAVSYRESGATAPAPPIPDGPPYLAVAHPQTGQRVGVEINGRVYVGVATVEDQGNGSYTVSMDDVEPGPSVPGQGLFQHRPPAPWIVTTGAAETPSEPESRFDDRGRPRPPRPSRTPPMWANNPTRERRRRRNN